MRCCCLACWSFGDASHCRCVVCQSVAAQELCLRGAEWCPALLPQWKPLAVKCWLPGTEFAWRVLPSPRTMWAGRKSDGGHEVPPPCLKWARPFTAQTTGCRAADGSWCSTAAASDCVVSRPGNTCTWSWSPRACPRILTRFRWVWLRGPHLHVWLDGLQCTYRAPTDYFEPAACWICYLLGVGWAGSHRTADVDGHGRACVHTVLHG